MGLSLLILIAAAAVYYVGFVFGRVSMLLQVEEEMKRLAVEYAKLRQVQDLYPEKRNE